MKKILSILVLVFALPFFAQAHQSTNYFNDPSLPQDINEKVDAYLTTRCQNYHDTNALIQSARLTRTLFEADVNRPGVTYYTLDLAVKFDAGEGPFELYQMVQFDDAEGNFNIVSTFGACKAYIP